jgi:hypothetical protein
MTKTIVIILYLAVVGLWVFEFFTGYMANYIVIYQCPEYTLPEYLEPRTDGDCAAIGILLRKATAGRKCVYVTNDWWQGANPVHHELAIDLAQGY